MWFGVLGPLLVEHEGSTIEVSAARERLVLGALLVRPHRVVSQDGIIDAVWDRDPPASAHATLRNHIRRLRHTLGPAVGARIVTRHPGYLIEVGDDEYDLLVFTRLCRSGRAAIRSGDWNTAVAEFDTALELCRGDPLADVCSPAAREIEARRIEELRLEALESRLDAKLALGASTDIVGELRQLVSGFPLREHFHAQLMQALYRAGRQGEALSVYRAAHRVLATQLGVQPGADLRSLHQRILRADPDLLAPMPTPPATPAVVRDPPGEPSGAFGAPRESASAYASPPPSDPSETAQHGRAGPSEPPPVTPRQLPAPLGRFVGRDDDLKALNQAVDRALEQGGGSDGTMTIAVINGTAGIGKTALALRCAHQAAHRFPDGQLYVNLRGFDPTGQAVPPAAAIRGFLDALAVPVSRIPAAADAQIGLYRSLLAGKRALILLDNAGDVDQVRPLLPGGSRCLVLVTSRNALLGLVAAEGAQSVPLDVMHPAEARDLLTARLGAERVAADPRAAADLVELCAGLPLALGIVAARAALDGRLPLASLAAELRDTHRRLDALDIGDQTTDVRAALSWSYRGLGATAARMFRLLAVHPGPDITPLVAASLTALPRAEAHAALGELVRASLASESTPGRYTLHDLLRAYAAEQISTDAERAGALLRMLDHYLRTGESAARLLNPTRDLIEPPAGRPGVAPETLADVTEAMKWFEAEYGPLLKCLELAASAELDAYAWQLARVMYRYCEWRGHWHDWVACYTIGLASAERLGDRKAQLLMHRGLGTAHVALKSLDQATSHYQQALRLSRQLGDVTGQANAYRNLSLAAEMTGHDDQALEHSKRALELFTAAGGKNGQAHALNDLGWSYAQLGDYTAALDHCTRALNLLRDTDDIHGQAAVYTSLGYAHRHLGNTADSAACYTHAVAVYQLLGDRYRQAAALQNLAAVVESTDDAPAIREYLRQALTLLEEIDHPDADRLRTRLRSLR